MGCVDSPPQHQEAVGGFLRQGGGQRGLVQVSRLFFGSCNRPPFACEFISWSQQSRPIHKKHCGSDPPHLLWHLDGAWLCFAWLCSALIHGFALLCFMAWLCFALLHGFALLGLMALSCFAWLCLALLCFMALLCFASWLCFALLHGFAFLCFAWLCLAWLCSMVLLFRQCAAAVCARDLASGLLLSGSGSPVF